MAEAEYMVVPAVIFQSIDDFNSIVLKTGENGVRGTSAGCCPRADQAECGVKRCRG